MLCSRALYSTDRFFPPLLWRQQIHNQILLKIEKDTPWFPHLKLVHFLSYIDTKTEVKCKVNVI